MTDATPAGVSNETTRFARGAFFSLPEYERPFNNFVSSAIRALSLSKDPLYAQMGKRRGSHIPYPRTRISLQSGQVLDSPGVSVKMTFEFNADELVRGVMDSVHVAIDSAAEQNISQVMPYVFAQLSNVTEAVGNSVDAGGQPFSWDLVNDMLARMDIAFDHDGNPSIPQLAMHPETAAGIPPITEAQLQERDRIIERKRQQFLARRRTRRLPRESD
jgi:hypothetical protein